MRLHNPESSSLRESWHGGDEDIEGELWIFLDTRKASSEKIAGLGGGLWKFVYFKTNRRGGLLKIELLVRGGCKNFKLRVSISSSSLVILNELSITFSLPCISSLPSIRDSWIVHKVWRWVHYTLVKIYSLKFILNYDSLHRNVQ